MTNKKNTVPKLIYHYCSIEAFLSIIQNGELYLSTTKYMNDYMESKWLSSLIKKLDHKYRANAYYTFIFEAQYLISRYTAGIYMACFSSHKDMLSQWRGYANNGGGIAIGFDTKILATSNPEEYNDVFNLSLKKVIYDSDQQNKIIIEMISKFKVAIEDAFAICRSQFKVEKRLSTLRKSLRLKDIIEGKEEFKNPIDKVTCEFAQNLIVLSWLFKNYAFHEEGEYRLCHFPNFGFLNSPTINKQLMLGELIPKIVGNKIKTHYPLNFSDNKPVIKEIILGPTCQTDKDIIKFTLEKYGFGHVKISKSTATYRTS